MWKLLIAICFLTVVPLLAQEKAPQPPPPPPPPPSSDNYRLEFTISEIEGTKKLQSRNYSMLVVGGRDGRLRVGNRIPISVGVKSGEEQIQYNDLGVNIDARAAFVDAHSVRLSVTVEVSGLAGSEPGDPQKISRRPIVRQFNNRVEVIIPLDKAVLLTSQDEPGTNTTFQVQAVVKIQK